MIRRWGIPVLALLGLIVSGYLSYEKLTGGSILCVGGSTGCDRVNMSSYAYIAGTPVAYLGFVGYLLLGLLGWYAAQPRPYANTAALLGWGCSLIGFFFSLWLTYVELFILHDICQWCVISAVLQVLIFVLFMDRVTSPPPA